MALTEKKKNEILESQKQLAADKLRFKQDVMEKILKNYNLDRINILRKSIYENNENTEAILFLYSFPECAKIGAENSIESQRQGESKKK